ncbi:MAG TPA: glutaredoxin family protein [Casimicrobiaceae bacterium]|jgi:glutaredoxin|nr:glutaredoxin family protein [Casimicrobiaceae bacterium]
MAPHVIPRTLIAVAILALAASATAQTQVYRYTDADGRIVYSDRPPPSNAKNVQPKRLGANYIETSQMPLATQQAIDRNPVTLYTYDCGDVCQQAEALLNRRGVPYTTVDVTQPDNAAKLQSISGEQRVPVLQVGEKVEKGFLDSRWQAALDAAGYPKAPPSRLASTPRAPAEKPASDVTAPEASVATPAKGTDYPK